MYIIASTERPSPNALVIEANSASKITTNDILIGIDNINALNLIIKHFEG